MNSDNIAKYIPLLNFEDDYEILNQYPFTIKRKSDNQIISEYTSKEYIQVCLNNNVYFKHRIMAEQFIPNPNQLPWIDHKNRIKTDNRLEKLFWCTPHENQMNKSSNMGIQYEYVKTIPDNSIPVKKYGNHNFELYYYCDDAFYYFNGNQYRKLYINEYIKGHKIVNMIDTNGKRVRVYYSKFKSLYHID